MKDKFIILLTFLFLGCTLPKADRFQPEDNRLPIDELLLHVNYVLKELKSQGFSVIIAKPEKNRINIAVRINGKEGRLLLDTGASFTFLSDQYLKRFQLSEYAYMEGRNPSIQTYLGGEISDSFPTKADKFEIGNRVFQPWPFDVNKSSPSFIKHGALGVDFLHFTSSVLICRAGALFLSSDDQPARNIGCELKKLGYTEIELLMRQTSGGIEIKRQMEGYDRLLRSGVFAVPICFEGIGGMALLDTGAPCTSIDKSLAKKTDKRIKYHPHVRIRDAKGKSARVSSICLSNLCVGDYCLEDHQYVAVIDHSSANEKRGLKAKYPLAGVIGFDILATNNAIIDFGNRRLYMQK
jgi:predicted aspartyl protease